MVINPTHTASTLVKQPRRRIEAEVEIRACLEDIRMLEGFHRFLLGPTQEELKAATAQGPIVIVNITSIRSDVIISTQDASVLLPLPELKYQKVLEYLEADLTNFSDLTDLGNKNRAYVKMQKWLWDNCVKLIFEKLDGLVPGPSKFHVWWIGVGIASSLPFHAAGVYRGKPKETALSRAISSYIPTLKVQIHGRRKLMIKNNRPDREPEVQHLTSKSETKKHVKPSMAISIMPSTPEKDDLSGVKAEAEEVKRIVGNTYLTQIMLQPSASNTMARMAECEVVHFACHGESILADPSSSHLLLWTTTPNSQNPTIDKLRVRDVLATDLRHGKLAFLSACSTAQNRPRGLWDEVLHLASGFQVAGYLHGIGNLWPADDDVSVELVTGFYQHLVAAGELGDGENVAKALNEALLDVAKSHAKDPLSWAQFVHFGV